MAKDYSKSAGNKMINIAIQKAEEVQGDNKKINIPIELIDENPNNEFLMGYEEDPTLFAEHIKEEGFYGVINVFAKKDGRYEIFSGHRRYYALKQNGEKTIPCIVFPEPDDATKLERLMGSNIHVRSMDPLHLARCIKSYKDEVLRKRGFKGDTNAAAATFFGFSRTKIIRYEAILSMIPEIQKLAENPKFPYGILYKVREAKLNQDDQYDLWKRIEREIQTSEEGEISSAKFKLILGDIIRHREIREINAEQKKSVQSLIAETNPDMADRMLETAMQNSKKAAQNHDNVESVVRFSPAEYTEQMMEEPESNSVQESVQVVPIIQNRSAVETPDYKDEELKSSYEQIRDMKLQNAQFKSKAMAKERLKEMVQFIEKILEEI